jgi:hypothetical protein
MIVSVQAVGKGDGRLFAGQLTAAISRYRCGRILLNANLPARRGTGRGNRRDDDQAAAATAGRHRQPPRSRVVAIDALKFLFGVKARVAPAR